MAGDVAHALDKMLNVAVVALDFLPLLCMPVGCLLFVVSIGSSVSSHRFIFSASSAVMHWGCWVMTPHTFGLIGEVLGLVSLVSVFPSEPSFCRHGKVVSVFHVRVYMPAQTHMHTHVPQTHTQISNYMCIVMFRHLFAPIGLFAPMRTCAFPS